MNGDPSLFFLAPPPSQRFLLGVPSLPVQRPLSGRARLARRHSFLRRTIKNLEPVCQLFESQGLIGGQRPPLLGHNDDAARRMCQPHGRKTLVFMLAARPRAFKNLESDILAPDLYPHGGILAVRSQ